MKLAKNDFNLTDLRKLRELADLNRQKEQLARMVERLTYQGEKGWVVA